MYLGFTRLGSLSSAVWMSWLECKWLGDWQEYFRPACGFSGVTFALQVAPAWTMYDLCIVNKSHQNCSLLYML